MKLYAIKYEINLLSYVLKTCLSQEKKQIELIKVFSKENSENKDFEISKILASDF